MRFRDMDFSVLLIQRYRPKTRGKGESEERSKSGKEREMERERGGEEETREREAGIVSRGRANVLKAASHTTAAVHLA
jgi:hypothetical protein